MKSLNNEYTVRRNEAFPIDKIVENKDGSPYIISSALQNPYFLITISSTRYDQQDRYCLNKWLDISSYPRFNNTTPVDLHVFKKKNEQDQFVTKYNNFSDITELDEDGHVAAGWVDGEWQVSDPGDDVFFIEDEEGNRTYKYWDVNAEGLKDYYCRIVTQIRTEQTKDWIEQTYVYSITLVTGELMRTYLTNICDTLEITYTDDDSNIDLYDKIIETGYVFGEYFVPDRPIANFDDSKVILNPTKITVGSSISGGLFSEGHNL